MSSATITGWVDLGSDLSASATNAGNRHIGLQAFLNNLGGVFVPYQREVSAYVPWEASLGTRLLIDPSIKAAT